MENKSKDIQDSSSVGVQAANPRLQRLTETLLTLPPDQLSQLENLIGAIRKKPLTLKEAALRLNVSVDTVRRAIKAGRIKAFRLNKAGDFRISPDELDQFMKEGKQR